MSSLKSIENWSKTQDEVWKNVKDYTELIMKGDIESFLDYFHKNYSGWNNCEMIPANKASVKNELWHLPKSEILSYNISPVAINVFKDVAIVHYYYSAASKNREGKINQINGRNTDILLKQKDKWILIGDHVGRLSN